MTRALLQGVGFWPVRPPWFEQRQQMVFPRLAQGAVGLRAGGRGDFRHRGAGPGRELRQRLDRRGQRPCVSSGYCPEYFARILRPVSMPSRRDSSASQRSAEALPSRSTRIR